MEYDYLFKIVLAGPTSVGKTCIVNRFLGNAFDPESKSTIGVEFGTKDVTCEGKHIKLQIWDTAGQERFRSLSNVYYRGAHGIIVVFDITNRATFEEAAKMLSDIPNQCVRDDAVMLLVGNKADLPNREVLPEMAHELADQFDCNYVEVSAKNGTLVEEAIMSLITGNLNVPSAPAVKRRMLSGGTTNLPLTDINVKCEIRDLVASVVISQRFENTTENPLELTIGFPVDELGSVCKFEATKWNGDKIVGKVLPKHQATETYDDAIAAGKCAVLLEEKLGGVFIASVGMLEPGKHITVETTYITELQVIRGDVFQFTYKTLFDRANRMLYFEDTSKVQVARPNCSIQVDILANSPITDIKCNSHHITSKIEQGDKHAIIEANSGLMDDNFDLRFQVKEPHSSSAWLEHNPTTDTTAVMIPFLPEVDIAIDSNKTAYVFVVDRSGSMAGASWEACSAALQIFLRSIPVGCYFQVVGFGSQYQTIFDESKKYDDQSLSFASDIIASWTASLGGTELLWPLEFIYSTKTSSQIKYRKVIILTDGAVANTNDVVSIVRKNRGKFETSCMGIGGQVDKALVHRVAEAGGGSEEFAPNTSSLEIKVIKQLKRAMGLELNNIKVNWGDLPVGEFASSKMKGSADLHVFKGEKLMFYALLDTEKKLEKGSKYKVVITGSTKSQETLTFEITVDADNIVEGSNLHALAARYFIKQLASSDFAVGTKDKLVGLSTKYNVSSQFASFVAVEENASGEATENTMQKVDMTMNHLHTVKSGMLSRGAASSDQGVSAASMAKGIVLSESSKSSSGCCEMQTITSSVSDFFSFSSEPFASSNSPANPPARKPTPKEAPPHNKTPNLTLTNLISQQLSEGQWELDRRFGSMLEKKEDEIHEGISVFDDKDPSKFIANRKLLNTLWATAVALAILETKYLTEQDKWTLVSTKSYEWLDSTLKKHNIAQLSADDWVCFAKKWIKFL